MYIRGVKTKNPKNGKVYVNYKLVQNHRVDGEPRQKILLSLGNLPLLIRFSFTKENIEKIRDENIEAEILSKLDKLEGKRYCNIYHLQHALNKAIEAAYQEKYISVIAKHSDVFEKNCKLLAQRIEELYVNQKRIFSYEPELEKLAQFYHNKLLKKHFNTEEFVKNPKTQHDTDFQEVDLFSFTSSSSWQIGGEFLLSQALEELQIPQYLLQEIGFGQSQSTSCILSLIGRLLHPSSENETAAWLNENSGIFEFYSPKSASTNKDYLYEASLNLYRHKDQILSHINRQIDDIFNLKSKVILYDLTNTHFEGRMPKSKKASFGKNKQKRFDCKQITLAMITDEYGFCRHSRYYPGNVGEISTLEDILNDLLSFMGKRPLSEKPCIVMDAGIASEDNLKMCIGKGFDYIAVSRSQHKELKDKLSEDDLMKFKNKSGDELSARTFSQNIEYQDLNNQTQSKTESIVYVKSPQKEIKEKSIDQKKCQRFEDGLQAIQKTVNNPRGQRNIEKIHQRFGRLKERNRGVTSYFEIEIKDDKKNVTAFEWKKISHPVKEKKWGTYFIRTTISEKQEDKIWHLYRTINEVETTFRELKSDLDMQPNHHQSDENIEAHINLCILSYQIVNFIRHRLKQNGINLGWKKIRRIMETQKCSLTAINKRDGRTVWVKSCTRPTASVSEIFTKMGYRTIPYYSKNITV